MEDKNLEDTFCLAFNSNFSTDSSHCKTRWAKTPQLNLPTLNPHRENTKKVWLRDESLPVATDFEEDENEDIEMVEATLLKGGNNMGMPTENTESKIETDDILIEDGEGEPKVTLSIGDEGESKNHRSEQLLLSYGGSR